MTKILAISFAILCFITACNKSGKPEDSQPAEDLPGVITISDAFDFSMDTIRILNSDGSIWYASPGKDTSEMPSAFQPLIFAPDNFLFGLRVVSKKDSTYEIIANEETGIKKYIIPDGHKLLFKTMDQFLIGQGIVVDSTTNPLRKEIDGEIVNIQKDHFTQIVGVKNDWVYVKLTSNDNGDDLGNAWVKWREGDKVVIGFFRD